MHQHKIVCPLLIYLKVKKVIMVREIIINIRPHPLELKFNQKHNIIHNL